MKSVLTLLIALVSHTAFASELCRSLAIWLNPGSVNPDQLVELTRRSVERSLAELQQKPPAKRFIATLLEENHRTVGVSIDYELGAKQVFLGVPPGSSVSHPAVGPVRVDITIVDATLVTTVTPERNPTRARQVIEPLRKLLYPSVHAPISQILAGKGELQTNLIHRAVKQAYAILQNGNIVELAMLSSGQPGKSIRPTHGLSRDK